MVGSQETPSHPPYTDKAVVLAGPESGNYGMTGPMSDRVEKALG